MIFAGKLTIRMIMTRTWLALLAAVMAPLIGSAQETADSVAGLRRDVVFSDYFPLSGSVEPAPRTLSPLANVEIARAARNAALRPQAVDLTQERFSLYLPAQRPAPGCALMVFIPPWQDAHLPSGWATVLEQRGMVFVSAAKSGNDAGVLAGRLPLALL